MSDRVPWLEPSLDRGGWTAKRPTGCTAIAGVPWTGTFVHVEPCPIHVLVEDYREGDGWVHHADGSATRWQFDHNGMAHDGEQVWNFAPPVHVTRRRLWSPRWTCVGCGARGWGWRSETAHIDIEPTGAHR